MKSAKTSVWVCISAHGMGDLHICEGIIDAERKLMLEFWRDSMSISAGQCQASFCTSYKSVAS